MENRNEVSYLQSRKWKRGAAGPSGQAARIKQICRDCNVKLRWYASIQEYLQGFSFKVSMVNKTPLFVYHACISCLCWGTEVPPLSMQSSLTRGTLKKAKPACDAFHFGGGDTFLRPFSFPSFSASLFFFLPFVFTNKVLSIQMVAHEEDTNNRRRSPERSSRRHDSPERSSRRHDSPERPSRRHDSPERHHRSSRRHHHHHSSHK